MRDLKQIICATHTVSDMNISDICTGQGPDPMCGLLVQQNRALRHTLETLTQHLSPNVRPTLAAYLNWVHQTHAFLCQYGEMPLPTRIMTCKDAIAAFVDLQRTLRSISGSLPDSYRVPPLYVEDGGWGVVGVALHTLMSSLEGMESGDHTACEIVLNNAASECAAKMASLAAPETAAERAARIMESHARMQRSLQEMAVSLEDTTQWGKDLRTRSGMRFDMRLQVCLVGDVCGKSSVMHRYVKDTPWTSSCAHRGATIGVDYDSKCEQYGTAGCIVSFAIVDTASLPRYYSLTDSYLSNSDIIIVMYDITNRGSFDNVAEHLERVATLAPDSFVAIVGNKTDLSDHRRVSYMQGCALAVHHSAYFAEVSAKKGVGVHNLFRMVGAAAARRKIDREKAESERAIAKQLVGARQAVMTRASTGGVDLSLLTFTPFDPNAPYFNAEHPLPPYPGYHSGWLVTERGFLRGWKRQWVTISNGDPQMRWYASEEAARSKGSLRLSEITHIAISDASPASRDMPCLMVVTPSRVWYMLVEGDPYIWAQALHAHKIMPAGQ
ncbi:small GTPase superfamily, Rho type [Kipferlia bialata]|uniref:Small GTPase superfamily, Rho type n=1 Tax=Kipferlia bialata TaxID=797122 RepID=A0A391NV63_9EUKA|nr:small GTPase superfamily, Rho type [Kipferlia bialata]|eukprot:g3229.t1